MTSPLAPHIAEELWSRLGHDDLIVNAAFPQADESLAAAPVVVIPVRSTARRGSRSRSPRVLGEDEVEAIVPAHPRYAQFTADTPVARLIIVPGRIANIVTQ
jgi:Leucyl-tRNA synthetase